MYTDFNHLFTVTTRNIWHIKVKLRLSPHLCSVTPIPSKTHTTSNIHATFSNVQHSKLYSKQFSCVYSILAYLFTGITINVILCLWVNVVWFNGFNRLRGLIWAE